MQSHNAYYTYGIMQHTISIICSQLSMDTTSWMCLSLIALTSTHACTPLSPSTGHIADVHIQYLPASVCLFFVCARVFFSVCDVERFWQHSAQTSVPSLMSHTERIAESLRELESYGARAHTCVHLSCINK